MKLYVITKNLDIGFVAGICTCEECEKKGNAELTINYLDDSFMFQTTIKDILSRDEIIAVSNDIEKIKEMKLVLNKSDLYLCKYLESELLKK